MKLEQLDFTVLLKPRKNTRNFTKEILVLQERFLKTAVLKHKDLPDNIFNGNRGHLDSSNHFTRDVKQHKSISISQLYRLPRIRLKNMYHWRLLLF